MFILSRQTLKAHIAPFIYGTVILMFIFLLQFIMRYLDQLAGKGLSASIIAEFIVLNLAHMFVLAVPMAVLVATIMAFGGLSANNEVTAMRSCGISLYRMMAPAVIASVGMCIFLIYFFNNVLPDANHKAKVLTTDIYRKKPTLSLVPGLFSSAVQGYSILVRKTFENSNDLEYVTIFDHRNPSMHRTVTAERGTVSFSSDYRMLIMDLYDGEIHEANTETYKSYRRIQFKKHRIAMETEGFQFTRSSEGMISRGDREKSAQQMRAESDSVQRLADKTEGEIDRLYNENVAAVLNGENKNFAARSPDPRQAAYSRAVMMSNDLENFYFQREIYSRDIREYSVEIHKKYALSFACIVFVLVGAPLGVMSRKGTFGVAAFFSLLFFTIYWACLIGGEKLADRNYMIPWVGMWQANILIGALGLYLTFRTARESLVIDFTSYRRFIPKRWRKQSGEGQQA